MAEALQFDLVSPERLLMSEPVESVTVPGADGYFTVLINHAPFMTTLKPGVVDVHSESGDVQRIYVRGGFADVSSTGLTLLAEEAITLADVDADDLAQTIQNVREDIADTDDAEKKAKAESQLADLLDVQKALSSI